MLSRVYHEYFASHRPLRHLTQHLLIAITSFEMVHLLLGIPFTGSAILLFLVSTYAVDLDGVIALFRLKKNIPEIKSIHTALSHGHFKLAMTLATTHHKKMNRLIIHNIVGFIVVLLAFLAFNYFHNLSGVIITSAIISHFVFDLVDDVSQLGHINNWLWPIKQYLQPAYHP